MKTKLIAMEIIFLILVVFYSSGCFDSDSGDDESGVKVLVINSYHEGMRYVEEDLTVGIIEGLRRAGFSRDSEYCMKIFWMDTKVTYTTQEQIEQRAGVALKLIEDYKPNIVFINDDNALKYVAINYTENHPDSELPFVFAGINVDPTIYDPIESLVSPGGPITGALERYPYNETLSLAGKLLPNASKIILLADASPSSDLVVESFNEQYKNYSKNSSIEVIDFIQIETFQDWKDKINEYQTKADAVGILNYHQLRDEQGEIVKTSDVENWMIQNNHLPEIGTMPSYVQNGFLAVAGVSYYKSGIYVGLLGGEILNGGDPAEIPIIDPAVVDTYFNIQRADLLGLTIPMKELALATDVFLTIENTN